MPSIVNLSIAQSLGFICLGTLTYLTVRKKYSINFGLYEIVVGISLNIILGIFAWVLKPVISELYRILLFELVAGIIYLFLLRVFKIGWTMKLIHELRIIQNEKRITL